jgi:hypothetical protein
MRIGRGIIRPPPRRRRAQQRGEAEAERDHDQRQGDDGFEGGHHAAPPSEPGSGGQLAAPDSAIVGSCNTTRRKDVTMAKIAAMGISWFERDDYPRILQIMQDAHIFPADYDAWQQKAERQQRDAEARGLRVMRIVVKPDQFIAWCARNRLNVDAEARKRFAAEGAMRNLDN